VDTGASRARYENSHAGKAGMALLVGAA